MERPRTSLAPPGGHSTISFGNEPSAMSPGPAAAPVAEVAAPDVEPEPAPAPAPVEEEGPSLETLKLQAISGIATARDDKAVREALTTFLKVSRLGQKPASGFASFVASQSKFPLTVAVVANCCGSRSAGSGVPFG